MLIHVGVCKTCQSVLLGATLFCPEAQHVALYCVTFGCQPIQPVCLL